MDELWREMSEVLAAAEAPERDSDESHLICITRRGEIRILTPRPRDASLPALAADLGADRIYQVERRRGGVRVEGWSRGATVVLNKPAQARAALPPRSYATREILGV